MSKELDIENDQSIIDNTQLIPQGKGYYTMEVVLPDGHKLEHTELTLEEARKVMKSWCGFVRDAWKGREAEEQDRIARKILEKRRAKEDEEAAAADPVTAAREAELRAKLPQSERERDEERQGNRLVKPKPPVKQAATRGIAPEPEPERAPTRPISADPLAYAKEQYVYWSEEETKLEHASKMRAKWERVLQVLRESDDE